MRNMRHGSWGLVLAAVLCGSMIGACAGDEDNGTQNGTGGTGGVGGTGGTGGTGGIGGTGGGDPIPEGECGKTANLEKRNALLEAQPTIGVRSKSVIEATIRWASLDGNPGEECSVDLEFRDLNGNGTLDLYEDWTRPEDERAADLLARMDAEQKAALLAHPALGDKPTSSSQDVTAETKALVDTGVRFGRTAANTATPTQRATWANNLQALAEESELGVPFVISSAPAHSAGNGRTVARGFAQWPQELAIGATGDTAKAEEFGRVVSTEFRAIGVRMLLSLSADLATDPRRFDSQFSFGEDGAAVADMVGAFVKGAQGDRLGAQSIATVVGSFPGSGATKTGYDTRLEKGKYLTYSGTTMDAHVNAFSKAIANGVAGVAAGHGVVEQGAWTALDGAVDGNAIEQVGSSFNETLIEGALRGKLGHDGLVLSAWNALEDAGGTALGAPWGVEGDSKAQRAAKAIAAGVDQFAGLSDPGVIVDSKTAGVTDAQIDAAAARALRVALSLGLFENPYVDEAKAPSLTNADAAKRGGWAAQGDGMVLILNKAKPAGWLNGSGDGSQQADKGNAGNGTGLVLPAPPGEPYVAAGCAYFIGGNFDLDYVRSVSAGYGELTNDSNSIGGKTVSTAEQRMANSNYVFIRVSPPCEQDAASGSLKHCTTSLEYGPMSVDPLAEVRAARAAIDATPGSKTQIVVGIDGGRPSVVQELLDLGVSGLFQTWGVSDKVFLDVAFGIVNANGALPVGIPASDAAAAAQKPDVAGDGTHDTFKRGHGLSISAF